jgi:pimeloyl-ACP methyl ester carboxylesterase
VWIKTNSTKLKAKENIMFDIDAVRKTFTTSDGVKLSYLEAGKGQPFVMIPGWSQTADQWHHQINHFSKKYRVLALDMRGHGESEKPGHGYRIYRLSKDVKEFIEGLDLQNAILMGHSMGCSVLWGLYDLYGASRVSKFVFVDEPAYLSNNPTLSPEGLVQAGAIFTPEAAFSTAVALAADADGSVTTGFVSGMFTPECPKDIVQKSIALNFKFPRDKAAQLVIDHVHNDWRDVMARITVPALCIGGRASFVPWTCVVWQAEQIPNGQHEIFEANEGGSHFMFMENPQKFNARVEQFLN